MTSESFSIPLTLRQLRHPGDLFIFPFRIKVLDSILPVPEEPSDKEVSAGLIREDGQVLYPVRNGIPLLLPGSAIPLTCGPSRQ